MIMKPQTAKKLLKINQNLYEHQALDWDKSRQKIWEKPIEDFIKTIKSNSSVLDVGCGNARLYQLLKDKTLNYLGIDTSKKLIFLNRKRYKNVKFEVRDGLKLKYKNCFDYVLCLGVLHHIPTQKLQLKFLTNIYQVLKKDGVLFAHVWNRWQKRYLNKKIKKQFVDLSENEQIIPWRNSNKYARFVYRFTASELISHAKHAKFNNIEVFYADKTGKSTKSRGLYICLIAKK